MKRALVFAFFVVACDARTKASPSPAPSALPENVQKPLPEPIPTESAEQPKPVPPKMPIPSHVLLASLKRDVCYGSCPAYTISVYRDGKVEVVGTSFVKKKGKATGTVTAEQLTALEQLFMDAKYDAYADAYKGYDMTDRSSATTSYWPMGAAKPKTVEHYLGDMKAPESLTKLENGFDDIVKIERWIGTEAERSKASR